MELIALIIIAIELAFLNTCVAAFYLMERRNWSEMQDHK